MSIESDSEIREQFAQNPEFSTDQISRSPGEIQGITSSMEGNGRRELRSSTDGQNKSKAIGLEDRPPIYVKVIQI